MSGKKYCCEATRSMTPGYELTRRGNVIAGLCSHLNNAWLQDTDSVVYRPQLESSVEIISREAKTSCGDTALFSLFMSPGRLCKKAMWEF